MHQITVNNIEIDVVRKDIKNIHLAVYPPHGRVRIAIPLTTDDESVRLFVISKLAWIKKQRTTFEEQPRQSEREFLTGESHYYWGQRYLLNVIYQNGHPKVILRNKNKIDLYVREGSSQEQRKRVMTEWYRRQLKQVIPQYTSKWENIIGVDVKDWGVKLMKTKWGSCNIEARRVWLNLELAKKPVHCLEYILVHEMVHFLERYHNDNFIALIDKFMPLWKSYRAELNSFPLKHETWDY